MPPIESITLPSLKNLSIEEENSKIEHEATLWEANVAQNFRFHSLGLVLHIQRRKTHTLEDLETNTDDNMVNMTDFFDRPQNEKRSPRPKPIEINSEQCPTPQNSPTHASKPPVSPAKPIEVRFGDPPRQKKSTPVDGQLVSEGSHPG